MLCVFSKTTAALLSRPFPGLSSHLSTNSHAGPHHSSSSLSPSPTSKAAATVLGVRFPQRPSWYENLFISCGCCNKVSQTGWLKKTEIDCLKFWRLEVQGEGIGRVPLPPSFWCLPQPLVFLVLWPHCSRRPLSSWAASPPACVFPSLLCLEGPRSFGLGCTPLQCDLSYVCINPVVNTAAFPSTGG